MKKILLIFVSIWAFVFINGKAVFSTPINPYYTEYDAEAEGYYDDNAGNWGEYSQWVSQSSPPVEVSIEFSTPDYYGSAYAYTDGASFTASAEAWNSLIDSNSYVENYSYTDGYLEFTATQSSLYVSFDYQMNVSAQVAYTDDPETYAYAYAELYFEIYDITNGWSTIYTWNPYLEVEADLSSTSNSDSLSGTFLEYITLTPGNDYAIYLGPWWIEGDVYGNGTASAYATMNNITLAAVPLPSAFFLLGGSLLGGLIIRKKYR